MSLRELNLETERETRHTLKELREKYPSLVDIVSQMVQFNKAKRASWEQILLQLKSFKLEHYFLSEIISSRNTLADSPERLQTKLEDAKRKSCSGFYQSAIRDLAEVYSEVTTAQAQTEVKLEIAKSFFKLGDLERGALILNEIDSRGSSDCVDPNVLVDLKLEKLKLTILEMGDPEPLFEELSQLLEKGKFKQKQFTLLQIWSWWLIHIKFDFAHAQNLISRLRKSPDLCEEIEFGSIHVSFNKLSFDVNCQEGLFQKAFDQEQNTREPFIYAHHFYKRFSKGVDLESQLRFYQRIGNLNYFYEVTGKVTRRVSKWSTKNVSRCLCAS